MFKNFITASSLTDKSRKFRSSISNWVTEWLDELRWCANQKNLGYVKAPQQNDFIQTIVHGHTNGAIIGRGVPKLNVRILILTAYSSRA